MKIAIFIFGLLLLLPGLCGGFVFVSVFFDKKGPFASLAMIISTGSILLGCLGILVIAKSKLTKPANAKSHILAALLVSIAAIVVASGYLLAEISYSSSDELAIILILAGVAAITVPLPLFYHWKNMA